MNTNENTAVATPVAETTQRQRPTRVERGRKLPRLFKHATGQWAAKIAGRSVYFGRGTEAEAMQTLIAELPEWRAGRNPRAKAEPAPIVLSELTLAQLVNRFLTAKKKAVSYGELTQRSFDDLYEAAERMLKVIDGATRLDRFAQPNDYFVRLRDDFEKRGWGRVTVSNAITRTKAFFNFAFDEGLIDRPARFGEAFKPPKRKAIRAERLAKGERMLEPAELLTLLADVTEDRPILEAWILLALNAGLGNGDLSALPRSAINLETGWLDFPRPKTGVARRCPLWKETIDALKRVLKIKRKPLPEFKGLVFVTTTGKSYHGTGRCSSIGVAFDTLLRKHGLKRPGISFYSLRHIHATIAGESCDQAACDHIMGHSRSDMASVYRERISDERLKRVTGTIHAWLFAPLKDEGNGHA